MPEMKLWDKVSLKILRRSLSCGHIILPHLDCIAPSLVRLSIFAIAFAPFPIFLASVLMMLVHVVVHVIVYAYDCFNVCYHFPLYTYLFSVCCQCWNHNSYLISFQFSFHSPSMKKVRAFHNIKHEWLWKAWITFQRGTFKPIVFETDQHQ